MHESCGRGPHWTIIWCRGHITGMHSRVHPTYKTKYGVANWASYDRALVGRGDVTLWMSPEAIAVWASVTAGTRGGQQQYSDVAIETVLTLRLLFPLPLRQAERFVYALFEMMGLGFSAPDHTTLSRRGRRLDVRLRRVPTGTGLHLIVDITGVNLVELPGPVSVAGVVTLLAGACDRNMPGGGAIGR